jgi:hypothetical protein
MIPAGKLIYRGLGGEGCIMILFGGVSSSGKRTCEHSSPVIKCADDGWNWASPCSTDD